MDFFKYFLFNNFQILGLSGKLYRKNSNFEKSLEMYNAALEIYEKT